MFVEVGVDELKGWVEELSVTPASFADVGRHASIAARLRTWVDGVLAELAVAAASHAEAGNGTGAVATLQAAGRLSAPEARAVERRGALLAEAPAVGVGMACGAISTAHADAMAQVVAAASDVARAVLIERSEALVAEASTMTPEQFRQRCVTIGQAAEVDGGVSRAVRQRRAARLGLWTNRVTGMKCGRFELDPEWGDIVSRALGAEIDRLAAEHPTPEGKSPQAWFEHLGARALVSLVGHGHEARGVDAALFVHVDADTMVAGRHDHTLCELSDGTPVPVATALRLACCARVVPVVVGADGEVLSLGRETRLASRAQRRALRAIYRTCAMPGCDVSFDRCEIHHVVPFERLGPTDLANLLPLCWRHHHLVHEGGWTLVISPQRTITVTRPDGECFAEVALPEVARWARRRGRGRPPGPSPREHAPPGRASGRPVAGPPASSGSASGPGADPPPDPTVDEVVALIRARVRALRAA